MLDRSPIIVRGYKKMNRAPNLGVLAGGVGGLAPRGPQGGVGGDCCDTDWVRNLISRAAQCGVQGGVPGQLPSNACGPQASTLAFPLQAGVAIGASSSATIRIQTPNFMGRRLLLPTAVADGVTIDDVRVGNKSIFDSPDPLPGEAFSLGNEQQAGFLPFLPATAGMEITVYFTNTSGALLDFRAMLEGASW